MATPEYDDGFDSASGFERAGADRPEDMEPGVVVGLVDCEPTVGDVFGWLDDAEIATAIGQDLAMALGLQTDWADRTFTTTHGQKTAAGLARLVWGLIHDALPNR